METKKRSLLSKYQIPISHLDFNYLRSATNIKEVERIVKILHSGEEGHFPDLTSFAEKRLKELNPNSRVLRTEDNLQTKLNLGLAEWQELNASFIDWSNEIKTKDEFLSAISESTDENVIPIPQIRQRNKIIQLGSNEVVEQKENLPEKNSSKCRIKSTDYKQWDKYDPDTEILKMDLEEERIKEAVEIKKNVNLRKIQSVGSINIKEELENKQQLELLTDVEKEALTLKLKEKGNDYFRAKEYISAIREYSRCLDILPTAVGYNNRAVAYLKSLEYQKCVDDCEKCLNIEPRNIKALLRKAEALQSLDKKHKALEMYNEVIAIEPSNSVARHHINSLKSKLECAPTNATRIQIIDEPIPKNSSSSSGTLIESQRTSLKASQVHNDKKSDNKNIVSIKNNKKYLKDKASSSITSEHHEEDLSQLIIPNKIVKSKFATAMQNLEDIQKSCLKSKKNPKNVTKNSSDKKTDLILPWHCNNNNVKISEIRE